MRARVLSSLCGKYPKASTKERLDHGFSTIDIGVGYEVLSFLPLPVERQAEVGKDGFATASWCLGLVL